MAGNQFPSFTPIRGTDPQLSRVQTQLKAFTDFMAEIPLLRGRLIESVALSGTATLVEHGLDREPAGWFLVGNNAAVTVYSSSATTPKRHLKLTASGACTVSLWVF